MNNTSTLPRAFAISLSIAVPLLATACDYIPVPSFAEDGGVVKPDASAPKVDAGRPPTEDAAQPPKDAAPPSYDAYFPYYDGGYPSYDGDVPPADTGPPSDAEVACEAEKATNSSIYCCPTGVACVASSALICQFECDACLKQCGTTGICCAKAATGGTPGGPGGGGGAPGQPTLTCVTDGGACP